MWRLHAGPASTQDLLESCFAQLKDAASRQSKNQKMNAYNCWMQAVANPVARERVLPKDADWSHFFAKRSSQSDCKEAQSFSKVMKMDQTKFLNAEHVELPKNAAGMQKLTWRNSGPLSHYKSASAMKFLMLDCEHGFTNATKAWCGTVLERNSVFWNSRDGLFYLSLGFHKWCAMAMKFSVVDNNGQELSCSNFPSSSPTHPY